jgi:hypothetical protein
MSYQIYADMYMHVCNIILAAVTYTYMKTILIIVEIIFNLINSKK